MKRWILTLAGGRYHGNALPLKGVLQCLPLSVVAKSVDLPPGAAFQHLRAARFQEEFSKSIGSRELASVLITGTSKGIVLETALAFGRAGHTVYTTRRPPSRSPALAEMAAQEKLPITICAMDVDSDASVTTAIAAIVDGGQSINVLVNNTGVERTGSVEELPLSEVRAVMETNYFGALRCIQAVAPGMRKRQSGCIMNLSSVADRITCAPLTSYTASRFIPR